MAKMSAENVDWFFIDTVNIEKSLEGTYIMKIVIKANSKDLPLFPKLVHGETQIGGLSTLHFDENDNFEYGEVLFSLNASSEKEVAMMVESSSLVVRDALIRMDSSDLEIMSNVRSLSVVVSE